jgi:hypothetical protein
MWTVSRLVALLFGLAQTGSVPVIPATVVPAGDIQAAAAQAIANKISDTSLFPPALPTAFRKWTRR